MLDCLARWLCAAALDFIKQWLRDWSLLLLTAVIAGAAVMQGIFAFRLYKLQNAIEQSRLTPLLYCRVRGGPLGSVLRAELSNLSTYGVWIEQMTIVLSGPVRCKPEITRKMEMVLSTSQTEIRELFDAPFAEIVPIGDGITFKLQVKFYYSTPADIGTVISP